MSNAAHTPGKWHVTEYTKAINPAGKKQRFATVRSGNDYWVADALPLDCEYGEADARLIAAAPDLLEACRAAEHLYTATVVRPEENKRHPIHALRAAIAKATGGESR